MDRLSRPNRFRIAATSFCVAALLTGCPSSDPEGEAKVIERFEPPSSSESAFVGTVSLTRSATVGTDSGGAIGIFSRIGALADGSVPFDKEEALRSAIAARRAPLLLDVCTLETKREGATVEDGPRVQESQPVSAGDVLTFTAPGGTWLTVPQAFDGFYLSLGLVPVLPEPGALALDVPGDAFPAFAS